MTNKYYSVMTNSGINYINTQILSGEEKLITNDWYIALGTGEIEPTNETTSLKNKIFDKNSEFYGGISFGYDETGGHYAEILIPSALSGKIITEAGLYNSDNLLIAVAKTHIDLTEASNGLELAVRQRIYISAVPASVQIIYTPHADLISKDDLDSALEFKQDNLTAGDNVVINNNVISAPNLLKYKNITNCVLEAPSDVFRLNAEGKYCVPKGTRFLSANGIDINGNIKNLDITLTSDVVFSTFVTENSDYVILFLSSIDGGVTWQYGYRYYPAQWYEQTTQPNISDGTWYNSQDKKWRNIQTQDGTGQWYDCNMIPIALVSLKNYLVDKVYKIFEPIELLKNTDKLTKYPNYANVTTIPFNTIFTAPIDGEVFVFSNISVTANYLSPTTQLDVAGYLDPVRSGANNTITKTASQEYRNVGTYTFNAPNTGWYKFILVGGGGTGGRESGILSNGQVYANGGSGGSGAAFAGEIYLTAGNHTVTVGGFNGATSVDGLVVAGNGTAGGGNTGLLAGGYAGAGGTVSITGQTQNVTMQANGNAGQAFTGDASGSQNVPGGASLYNGWGAGAGSNGSPATGYAYVEYQYTETVESETITGTLVYTNFNTLSWDGSSNTISHSQNTSTLIPIKKGQKILFASTFTPTDFSSVSTFVSRFNPLESEV